MGQRFTVKTLSEAMEGRLGVSAKSLNAARLRVHFDGDFTVTARFDTDGKGVTISTPVMAIHSGLPALVLARVVDPAATGALLDAGQLKERENRDFFEIVDHCSTELEASAIVERMIAQKNAAIRLTVEIREAIGALL